MPQSDPSRTEDPTQKRISKARDEGNVAKSEEPSKAITVLIGMISLWISIKYFSSTISGAFRWFFAQSANIHPSPENMYALLTMCIVIIAKAVLPIILPLALAAFLTQRLQVGDIWTTKVFKPKFGKMFNVLGNLKNKFFSLNTAIRLGKQLFQAAAIAIAPYIVLKQEFHRMPAMFHQTTEGIAVYMLSMGAKMVFYALIPMIIIAIADLIYQRWDYNENLKMTKDEVKDERKQAEGDPQIKSQQRQKMMSVMMQRMMEQVPKADVVITNPTHLAIALRYDPMEAPAPMVLAKGANAVAERIKEIAREHNIPVRENKPLAQALYKSVEIGDMIPEELYQAVASILAQLWKFRNRPRPQGV